MIKLITSYKTKLNEIGFKNKKNHELQFCSELLGHNA